VAAGHADVNAAHTDPYQRADLQELQAQALAGRISQFRAVQVETAQCFQHHLGKRGEPQSQLIGPHRGSGSAIGKQVELARLDSVFHLTTRTVKLFVERLG